MELRAYQATALRKFETSEHRACLIVAPTGAGKGTMATELMVRAHRARRRALFLVHRREIVNDIVERLAARRVRTAQTLYNDAWVRVASVQSVLRSEIQPVDLLIVDEAHHYAADEWQDVVRRVHARRVVGFTATPQRADGRPLGDMFTEIIETVSYSALTKAGLLVPARVMRPKDNLRNDLAQDPAEVYLRYARGEQALIFVRRVADADAVRDRLRAQGIAAESVHANTRKERRDEIMRELEEGHVRAVANVGTLTEGVDVPHVTTCILARSCAHASTYVQIVGRVLRAAPGKKLATVIDLVGASHVHGLPGADLSYSLEGRGLSVRTVERESRSGPSGPHRDQEVLDMELECVHTYAPARYESGRLKPDQSKTGRTVATHGKQAYAPLRRQVPQARTGGLLAQEPTGHWKLVWYEHGARRTMGLATRDREIAEETHRIFLNKGEDAARATIRQRKRCGASVWKHRESSWYYMTAWNEALTEKIKYSLNTQSRELAERMLDVFKAGNRAHFEQLCAAGRDARANAARAARAASVAASWEARRVDAAE